MYGRVVAFVVAAALAGCTAAPTTAKSPHPSNGGASDRSRAFHELTALLGSVRDRGPVLDALPPALKEAGRALLAKSSAVERRQLLDPKTGLSEQHPVLYLLVGGKDSSALFALGAQGRGSADLLALSQASGATDSKALLLVARELSRRAATHWLRQVAKGLHRPSDLTPELCDSIGLTARSLLMPALAERSVEMAAAIEPSRERWLGVADARAGSLDVAGARRALATALRRPWKHPELGRLERVRRDVAAAAVAGRALPADAPDGALLKKARALMTLDCYEEAVQLLGASRARVRRNAALAATSAVATLDAVSKRQCPIASRSYLSQVCFSVVNDEPAMKDALETLRSAWQSGRGRDPTAAATYVGLLYMLPLSRDLSEPQTADLTELRERSTALEAALAEAEKVSPALRGVHLCSMVVNLMLTHQRGTPLWASSSARASFRARALQIAKLEGADRRGQEGVTCAAVVLARDEDSSSLFDALPEEIEPGLRITRANVRLWVALIKRDRAAVKAATVHLLKALPGGQEDPTRRAALVLQVAEVQAAMTGSTTAYQDLGVVAERINQSDFSPELRLRATIDQAGARSRAGDRDGAVKLLLSIPEQDKKSAPAEADIAEVYALALQAEAAHGAARKPLVERLEKVSGKYSGSAFGVWRDMWVREIQFLSAMDRCGKRPACVKRAARHRRLSDSEIDQRLGPWLGDLTRRGTLSYVSFEPKLGYSTLAGLSAHVGFSFALPAVEYPIN